MTIARRVGRILRGKLRGAISSPGEPTTLHDGAAAARYAAPHFPARACADPQRAECLSILELGADAAASEVRAAYKRLCKRYHPDRFADDPDRARLANELLTAVNAAYAYLTA